MIDGQMHQNLVFHQITVGGSVDLQRSNAFVSRSAQEAREGINSRVSSYLSFMQARGSIPL